MNRTDCMARHVKEYLALRRAFGFQLSIAGPQLQGFARFADRMAAGKPLTLELALRWAQSKLHEVWCFLCATAKSFEPSILRTVGGMGNQFSAAKAIASRTHDEIHSALPRPRRRSAIAQARLICLISKQPLSLPEIGRRMRSEGYSSRSKHFVRYLRRVLRESKQFVEVSPGMWSLQGT